MTTIEEFAKRLKTLRTQKGVSLKKAAEALGVTAQSLSLYENGMRTINIDLLKKVAQYFDVSSDYLIGLSDTATTDTDLKAVCDYVELSEKAVEKLRTVSKEDGVDCTKIQDWVICKGYLENITYLLWDLECETRRYIEEVKSAKKDPCYKKEMAECIGEIIDDTLRCDTFRYKLIRVAEEMANHFDRREQVKNNGNHNPTNE